MKNLSLVSFVGVDEKTDFAELERISNTHTGLEFVEWSVLFSDSKSAGNYARYPSYKFCKEFLEKSAKTTYVHSSLHLCGSVIERYLEKEKDVIELCENARRIQLNLNIKDYPDHVKLTERLWSVLKQYGHSIILQQNKTKAKFMEIFLKENSFPISILHDGSGGFGREITEVVAPDEIHFTGYAGGIKPENVIKIVDLVESSNTNSKQYYIDMESGVRTDNVFSLEKCQQVINKLKGMVKL
jgi:phosphoribosylanthranilate isomerase